MWRGTFLMRSRTARLLMPCSRRRCTRRSRVRALVMPMPDSRVSAIERSKPGRQLRQRGMPREVDLQRRHGYEPLGDGVEVGARAGVLLGPGRADPVDRAPARVLGPHDPLGAVAVAQAAGTKPAQL